MGTVITKEVIQDLQVGFNRIYQTAWTRAEPKLAEIATDVPSTTAINTYGWMAKLLKMRKWEGPRIIQNLKSHAYQVENDDYEVTVGVDRNNIEDDQLGIYNHLFTDLGAQVKLWKDPILKTALQAGTTALGFDGVPMFSASHPLNPAGVQSNNFTTTALSATNFGVVRAAMMAYTGEDGEPLGIMPDTLVVPPQLADLANTIVTAEFGASGASNVQKGQARVLVIPHLANQATTWYLADTSGALKGLVFQTRREPKLVSKTDVTEDNVFWLKQFVWGADGRGAAAYGPWFLMARAIA
jgi:phage major head subunit gpT-like protein